MLEFESIYGKIIVEEIITNNKKVIKRDGETREGDKSPIIKKAGKSLEDGFEAIKIVSQSMIHKIGEIAKDMRPEEVKMKLGITFTAEAGVVIAKTGAEGTIEVEITWKKS